MITNSKVADIEKMVYLTKKMQNNLTYLDGEYEEFKALQKQFLGVDLISILLDEIKFLGRVRLEQSKRIKEALGYVD